MEPEVILFRLIERLGMALDDLKKEIDTFSGYSHIEQLDRFNIEIEEARNRLTDWSEKK